MKADVKAAAVHAGSRPPPSLWLRDPDGKTLYRKAFQEEMRNATRYKITLITHRPDVISLKINQCLCEPRKQPTSKSSGSPARSAEYNGKVMVRDWNADLYFEICGRVGFHGGEPR